MVRYVPAGPVLSLQANGFTSLTLQWTDISTIAIPIVGYTVFRGLGASPQTFQQIGTTGQGVLTLVDGTISPATTYTYYVVGKYEPGTPTAWSNFLTLTTLALRYLYTLTSTHLYVYDVLDPANPALVGQPGYGAGGLPIAQIADADYLYIDNGTFAPIFQWSGNPTSPTNPNNFPSQTNGLIVRRNLSVRNNFAFRSNPATQKIESYNISNPSSISFINNVNWPGGYFFLKGNSLVFDPVNLQLLFTASDGGSSTRIHACAVDVNGNLSNAAAVGPAIDLNGGIADMAFLYNGFYWINRATYDNWIPYNVLNGSTTGIGLNPLDQGTKAYLGGAPQVKGKFVFLSCNNVGAGHQAVAIYDLSTSPSTLMYQLGGTSNPCYGLVVSGSMLYFAVHSVLYVYNISALYSTGGAPTLVGQVTGPSDFNGMSGYFSDGWQGNNGLCAT